MSSKGSNPAPKNTTSSSKSKPVDSFPGTPRPKARSSPPVHNDRNPKTNGTKVLEYDLSAKRKGGALESAGSSSVAEQPENKSLILKLKIPKSARKTVTRIVGLSQGPKRTETILALDHDGPRLSNKDHGQNQFESDVSKTGEKRRRPEEKEEVERSNKRQKPAAATGGVAHRANPPARTLLRSPATGGVAAKPPLTTMSTSPPIGAIVHKPHTPLRIKTPSRKSPANTQHGSGQRTTMSTPKRDLKATAMRRITSAEGNVQTPSGGTRNGTPTAPFSADRAARDARAVVNATSNTMTPEKIETAEWKAEQKRYLDLGRSRKHDADAILNRSSKNFYNEDSVAKNQGIALAIETVLCYMLAFCVGDEYWRVARNKGPGDIVAWRSLLGYLNFVIGLVEPIPHLHGLCLHLQAVCRETIQQYELDRLDRDPIPSAGSDDYADFKTKLVENSRAAHQAWLTGNSRLPCDELQQSYPRTWAKRAKAPKAKERLVMRKYNGGFYLPLGSTSSGIEAVRMGWSFLGEWCAKEGVRWEGKMGL